MKKYIGMVLGLAVSLSACNYDNQFVGTYNGAPATLSAYSKNVKKYCVSLNIKAGGESKQQYISAQSVYDASDFLKPVSFNTKGAECGNGTGEYLVGNRNVVVSQVSMVTERIYMGMSYCRLDTYKRYHYREDINFEVKKNETDATIGTFAGTGEPAIFTDRDHPVEMGPVYYCGNVGPYYGNSVIITIGGGRPRP